MINTHATVNETIKLYFEGDPELTDLSNIVVLNNGALVPNPVISIEEYDSQGIYCVTYTPSSTGRNIIAFNGSLIAYVDVVSKSIYSFLKNIEDESLGSWIWNKQTGKLQLLRQDGTSLANFDVLDSNLTASRERT